MGGGGSSLIPRERVMTAPGSNFASLPRPQQACGHVWRQFCLSRWSGECSWDEMLLIILHAQCCPTTRNDPVRNAKSTRAERPCSEGRSRDRTKWVNCMSIRSDKRWDRAQRRGMPGVGPGVRLEGVIQRWSDWGTLVGSRRKTGVKADSGASGQSSWKG